jgi:hypothetical protein
LYFPPDTDGVIKQRKKISARHVARIGKTTNAHEVLFGKSEGKRLLGRPKHRWEDDN